MTHKTLTDLLTLYMGEDKFLRRERRFYVRWWLRWKSPEYRKRREEILFKRARRRSDRLFKEEMMKRTPFITKISHEDHDAWKGGYITVPLNFNDK